MKKLLSVLLIALIITTMMPITELQAATKSAAAYLADGNKFLQQNKYPDAIKAFDSAIKLNSKYVEAYVGKGCALAGLLNYAEAIKVIDKAIALNSKYAPAHYNKGLSLYKLAKYPEALLSLDTALKLAPNSADTNYCKGAVLNRLEKYPDAITYLNKSINLNPKAVVSYYELGIAQYHLKKYNDALSNFNKAVSLKSNLQDFCYYRGMTYHALGKYTEALKDLNEAIIKQPSRLSFNRGKIENNIYRNGYLNMSISVPTSWVIQSDKTIFEITKTPEPKKENITKEDLVSFTPLFTTNRPLDDPEGSSANLLLIMENTSDYGDITEGSDYVGYARRYFEKTLDYKFDNTVITKELGGVKFDIITVETSNDDGTTVYQKFYCTIYRGYAVFFCLTYLDEAGLQEMESIINTIQFNK